MSEKQPEGERRRPALALRAAKVREGTHGDWGVTTWVRTKAEAEDIAKAINDRLRKLESEAPRRET